MLTLCEKKKERKNWQAESASKFFREAWSNEEEKKSREAKKERKKEKNKKNRERREKEHSTSSSSVKSNRALEGERQV